MRKRTLNLLLCMVLVISTLSLAACGNKNESSQQEVNPDVTQEAQSENQEVQTQVNQIQEQQDVVDDATSEETVAVIEVTDVSEREKDIYVYRDGLKIFGKIYLPEGEGPFPVIIFSNPMGGSYTLMVDVAKEFTDNGVAGVCFDFAGAVSPSKSEGSVTEYSVLTEAADLQAVIDGVVSLDYIDSNNMFFWGHSMGGFVAAYEGCQNPDLIKGMVLVEPSFQFHDQAREAFPEGTEIPDIVTTPMYCGGIFFKDLLSFDIFECMPNYKNDVLIVAGTVAPSIGAEAPEYFEKATNTFPSSEVIGVEGANHQFAGESRTEMTKMAIEFVTARINK